MKKLLLLAMTLMLTAIVMPWQLTDGGGPMPVCTPDQPNCMLR